MEDVFSAVAPLVLEWNEHRDCAAAGDSFTVGLERDGRIMVRVLGIGRDQDNPVNEELASWIAKHEGDDLTRTWGTEWHVKDGEAFVRVATAMGEAGATVTSRAFTAVDADSATKMFAFVASAEGFDRVWFWTWTDLQVCLQTKRGLRGAGGLFAQGYDYMKRGERRHPAWERLAKEMAPDVKASSDGTEVPVDPYLLTQLNERVLTLVDEPLKELTARVRNDA